MSRKIIIFIEPTLIPDHKTDTGECPREQLEKNGENFLLKYKCVNMNRRKTYLLIALAWNV